MRFNIVLLNVWPIIMGMKAIPTARKHPEEYELATIISYSIENWIVQTKDIFIQINKML